jgi:hypothetical protein
LGQVLTGHFRQPPASWTAFACRQRRSGVQLHPKDRPWATCGAVYPWPRFAPSWGVPRRFELLALGLGLARAVENVENGGRRGVVGGWVGSGGGRLGVGGVLSPLPGLYGWGMARDPRPRRQAGLPWAGGLSRCRGWNDMGLCQRTVVRDAGWLVRGAG